MSEEKYTHKDFLQMELEERLTYNTFANQYFEHEFWVDFGDQENPEPKIYHYTTLEGFYHILTSRCLWATNVHFLNDSEEYENGKRICVAIIKRFLEAEKEEQVRNYLMKLQQILEGDLSDTNVEWSPSDIFSTSFCKEGDLLSQWRGYGKSGGIAIGFDLLQMRNSTYMINSKYQYAKKNQILLNHSRKGLGEAYSLADVDVKLMEVKYEQEEKRSYFQYAVESDLKFVRESLKEEIDSKKFLQEHLRVQQAILRMAFPGMKDKSFQEEKECRLLAHFAEKDKIDVSYQIKSGIITPYISYRVLDNHGDPYKTVFPIKDIVIGPGRQQGLVEKSLRYFLSHQLDKELSGLRDLTNMVRCSQIPFRE